MKLVLFVVSIVCIALTITFNQGHSEPLSDCAQHLPWGAPQLTDGHTVDYVCHKAYISAVDPQTKGARWVAYQLTGGHTLGCASRAGLTFRVDPLLPADEQGHPTDYRSSGYDLGHLAPNQDFAWDDDEQRESFSMANVEPQLPALNRQGWERGEEYVRAWALQHGTVEVYVGPVMGGSATIGTDRVPVPVAFFKVIVDVRSHEVVSFVMPQKAIPKGPLDKWISTIANIAETAHVEIRVPEDAQESTEIWPGDLAGWRKAHEEACRGR